MNYKSVFFYCIVIQLLWLASFRCGNDYKKNSVVSIEGILVDEENNPLPYFKMYIAHDNLYNTTYQHKNENIFQTDANGNFLVLTPQPIHNMATDYFPMIKFMDTTWQNLSQNYWDTILKPLIVLPNYLDNQRIFLDTIKLKNL